MDKTSKRILAGVGVAALAIGAGFVGASMKGSPAAASSSTDASQGAFLKAIKDRGELRVGVAIAPPMTVQQADGTLGGPNLIPLQELAKVGFQVLAFGLPLLLLAWAVLGQSTLAWLLALLSQALGLLAERWFFFAQARHPQNIYYQAVS